MSLGERKSELLSRREAMALGGAAMAAWAIPTAFARANSMSPEWPVAFVPMGADEIGPVASWDHASFDSTPSAFSAMPPIRKLERPRADISPICPTSLRISVLGVWADPASRGDVRVDVLHKVAERTIRHRAFSGWCGAPASAFRACCRVGGGVRIAISLSRGPEQELELRREGVYAVFLGGSGFGRTRIATVKAGSGVALAILHPGAGASVRFESPCLLLGCSSDSFTKEQSCLTTPMSATS